MIPVISIVAARSNTGKTTVLCGIIEELKRRNYRVATIKHHHRADLEIDKPGKDSWKHSQAGADLVVVSSINKVARIENVEEEYSLDQILKDIDNVDIILTEGYKTEDKAKIEVLRKGVSEDIVSKEDELIATISDFKIDRPNNFNFEEIEKIVDFIEDKYLEEIGD